MDEMTQTALIDRGRCPHCLARIEGAFAEVMRHGAAGFRCPACGNAIVDPSRRRRPGPRMTIEQMITALQTFQRDYPGSTVHVLNEFREPVPIARVAFEKVGWFVLIEGGSD